MPRSPMTRALVALAIVVVLVVGGYAYYVANMAGMLPWQEEPTRIPAVPFADLPTRVPSETDDGDGTPVSQAQPGWTGIGTMAVIPGGRA